MEQAANNLLHNGFIKVHSTNLGGFNWEYVSGKDSVCTLLVEQNDSPLEDLITIGKQFRPGAYLSEFKEVETLTSAAGYIDDGETPVEAAHRESEEEFGARGELTKLGVHFVSPGNCTQVTHLFVMDVREWSNPTDPEEGVKPVQMSLRNALSLINNPYQITSLHLATLINKYAHYRGV